MTGYNEIILAAWLHNIDKFANRAGVQSDVIFDLLKDCSFQNVNIDEVKRLAGAWRNPSQDEEKIIASAVQLSAGTSDTDNKTETALNYNALNSLVAGLYLDKRTERKAYYRLEPMSGSSIFSCDASMSTQEDYKSLWKGFEDDFSELAKKTTSEKKSEETFEQFMLSFDTLMEHYTWCIPASSSKDEDVSLYRQSKLTAAFAGALYKYYEENKDNNKIADNILESEKKYFALIQGDMSGIQKYIFDIKSHKFSAKLLRARSFQVWALSEIIAQYLTKQFGVTHENIITTSGGKFLLLLPNTNIITEKLPKLRLEIEEYFLENFAGKITLVLSDPVYASGSDFKEGKTQNLINKIGKAGEEAKQEKMQAVLKEKGHVLGELYKRLQNNEVCEHCEIMPADKDVSDSESKRCVNCNDLIEIGKKLLKDYKIILRTKKLKKEKDTDKFVRFGEMVIPIGKSYKEFGYLTEYKAGSPLMPLPYEAPCDKDGDISTFETISEKASGDKKLAMFKADIDNLGLVFTSSWGKKENNRISFARYAQLSRYLHYFFSGYVAEFIGGENSVYKDKIYTVFSGGDDLCILGPWDAVIHFANDFHKKFDEFTDKNPSVTLSGGIVLSSPDLPVASIAEMAEKELDRSKKRKGKDDKGKSIVIKNAISVFGTTVGWDEFPSCLADAQKIFGFIQSETPMVSPSLVYKMIDFANRAKNVENGNLRDLLWQSNFRYLLARSIKPENEEAGKTFNNFGSSPEAMIKSRIAVCYALYANRKTEKKMKED